MHTKVYRMRVLSLIGWTLYTILTKAMFAAIVLLVGSIIFIVFGLDRVLHVSYLTALTVYVSFVAAILFITW